jgi:hypothetical protein
MGAAMLLRHLRWALPAAALLFTTVVPPAAGAQEGPTATAVSVCTPEEPFAVAGFVSGFPANETFAILIEFTTGGSAGTGFTTDANGQAAVGSVLATQPFTASVVTFSDPNGNIQLDPGEAVVLAGTLIVDQPCTDGTFIPAPATPQTAADCKRGSWRDLVDDAGQPFKNQGQCASFAVHASDVA